MSCISLLPFLAIFSFIVLFQHVIVAILAGIFSICVVQFIVYGKSLSFIGKHIFGTALAIITKRDYLFPLLFVSFVIIIVELLRCSGIMEQYKVWMQKKVSSAKGLQKAILSIATLFFIDDYLSSLSLSAFVSPLIDSYAIARVKFAYLLNSCTSALCVLVPLSSWTIMTMGQLKNLHNIEFFLSTHNLYITHLVLMSTPFLIYPLCSYFFAWHVVKNDISLGSMRDHEASKRVLQKYQEEEKAVMLNSTSDHRHKWVFFAPFTIFFSVIVFHVVLTYYHLRSITTSVNILQVIEQTDISYAMVQGIALGLGVLLLIMFFLKLLSFEVIKKSAVEGLKNIHSTLTVLLLAWFLAALLRDIGTLHFFEITCAYINGVHWLPLMIFFIAFAACLAMGSAWGTIALFIPLLSMTYSAGPLVAAITLASLISGAIAGTHFTPISDAIAMSSASAGCDSLDHFRTQLPYMIIPLITSLVVLTGICAFLPYIIKNAISWNILGAITVLFSILLIALISYFIKIKKN